MATSNLDSVVQPFYEYLQDYILRPDAKPKSHLARDAGISRMYLDDLLKQKSEVSLRVALRVANAMGTTLEKVLKTPVKCG